MIFRSFTHVPTFNVKRNEIQFLSTESADEKEKVLLSLTKREIQVRLRSLLFSSVLLCANVESSRVEPSSRGEEEKNDSFQPRLNADSSARKRPRTFSKQTD